MDLKGKLQGVARDIKTGKYMVTFQVDALGDMDKINDMDLRISLKKWSYRRSLDSNAYFHKLVDMIAQKWTPPISRQHCKNIMIARYGQAEEVDGKFVIYTTQAPPEYMMEQDIPHTSLIDTTIKNGRTFYSYKIYRGSHTYDSREMSILIEGTREEGRQLGVDVATPKEIEDMIRAWERNFGNAESNTANI